MNYLKMRNIIIYITNLNENEFIISNKEDAIKKPDKLTKDNLLGNYILLGIYKGIDLKRFSQTVEKGDNLIYFFEESEPLSRFQKRFEVNPPIKLKSALYYFDNNDKNIPFNIKIYDESELLLKYTTKKMWDVEVKGHVEIDGYKLGQGMRRLHFKNFEKNGNLKEIVMTKSILECYNEEISAIEKLILEFDSIVEYIY